MPSSFRRPAAAVSLVSLLTMTALSVASVPAQAAPVTAAAVSCTPPAASTDTSWLRRLNALRAAAGLAPVTVGAAESTQAAAAATVLAVNNTMTHYPYAAYVCFDKFDTADGNLAFEGASNGNLADMATSDTAADAVDLWTSAPLHLAGMLNPHLRTVGFAKAPTSAAPSRSMAVLVLGQSGGTVGSDMRTTPIVWPTPGAVLDRRMFDTFTGNEVPDPSVPCAPYTALGTPMNAFFGAESRNGAPAVIDVTDPATAFTAKLSNGTVLGKADVCLVGPKADPARRSNPDATYALAYGNQVIAFPRKPLPAGTVVNASLKVRWPDTGRTGTATWSFTTRAATVDPAPAPTNPGDGFVIITDPIPPTGPDIPQPPVAPKPPVTSPASSRVTVGTRVRLTNGKVRVPLTVTPTVARTAQLHTLINGRWVLTASAPVVAGRANLDAYPTTRATWRAYVPGVAGAPGVSSSYSPAFTAPAPLTSGFTYWTAAKTTTGATTVSRTTRVSGPAGTSRTVYAEQLVGRTWKVKATYTMKAGVNTAVRLPVARGYNYLRLRTVEQVGYAAATSATWTVYRR